MLCFRYKNSNFISKKNSSSPLGMTCRFLVATVTKDYISALAPGLDLSSIQKVITKVKDYLFGLEGALSRSAGRLSPNFSLCQIPVCVDIACKILNIPQFSRELAIKKSASSPQDYERAFQEAVNLLGVTFPIKFEDLCLSFGCSGIGAACERLLEKYQQEMMKKFEGKSGANFSKSVFKVVAFYLVATHQFKYKVDKRKLIEETRCHSKNFEDILESMRTTCHLGSNSGVEIKMKEDSTTATTTTTPDKSSSHKRKLDELMQNTSPSTSSPSLEELNRSLVIGLDETKVTFKKKKGNEKKISTTSQTNKNETPKRRNSNKTSESNDSSSTSTTSTFKVNGSSANNNQESTSQTNPVHSSKKQANSTINPTNPSKSTSNKESNPKQQKLILDFFK